MAKFKIEPAQRVKRLPPYLFGRLNALKLKKRQEGIDIIDLGMGNPMDGAPAEVVDKLLESAKLPKNHRYSVSKGIYNLRREMARKYERKWSVSLDPETEVLSTIGSKEGFSHFCLAMLEPGDNVIVPDPYFPIHLYAVALAGANAISVPLGNDEEFLSKVQYICEHIYPKPKFLMLNYPHNPTAMTVDKGFFEPIVKLAKKFNFGVVHDFAYGETCFDGYKAPSFLETKGAKDVGVEFTTLSKPYNMAGFRIGHAAGNAKMLHALATIKGYYDYGIFQPIQIASIVALGGGDEFIEQQNAKYQSRRDVVCRYLDELGWEYEKPRGSMFIWTKVAKEHLKRAGSIDYAMELMDKANVSISPGRAFGENGENYMRIALVENEKRLMQAMKNIKKHVKSS